jgi:hypothetical protein
LHTITTGADRALSVASADVDGDGDLDALSASAFDDKVAWYENAGSMFFFTLTPCRLLDTRSGTPLSSGVPRVLLVPPACGVPVDAKGVAVNLTVVGPTAIGHVVAYPADVPVPATSNLNFSAGQTRSNNAVVRLDGDGEIAFLAAVGGGGTVHLVVDVVGYFE